MLATAVCALILGALSLALSWWAASQAARSVPNAYVAKLEHLTAICGQLQSDSQGRDGKMLAWRAELEAVMEATEGLLESVERKRRQTAAAAAKLGGNGGGAEPSDAQWEAIARERGLL